MASSEDTNTMKPIECWVLVKANNKRQLVKDDFGDPLLFLRKKNAKKQADSEVYFNPKAYEAKPVKAILNVVGRI